MTDPTDVVREIYRVQKDVLDFLDVYVNTTGTGSGFAVAAAYSSLSALRDIALRLADDNSELRAEVATYKVNYEHVTEDLEQENARLKAEIVKLVVSTGGYRPHD